MTTSTELSCGELVQLITEYLEGTLEALDRMRFEAHLALCPGCETYLEQMRLTVRLLGSLREEDVPAPARGRFLRAFRRFTRRGRR